MYLRLELADIPAGQRDTAAKALDFEHDETKGLVWGSWEAWDEREALTIIGEILCEAGIGDWAVGYLGD